MDLGVDRSADSGSVYSWGFGGKKGLAFAEDLEKKATVRVWNFDLGAVSYIPSFFFKFLR